MAMSISTTQSVLWDQIQYAGDPAEFSWVLPVRSGAKLEIANDAWFEVLDAWTNVKVVAPTLNCGGRGRKDGGFGCGVMLKANATFEDAAGGVPNNGSVEVVHQATVGPYETVTLQSKNGDALSQWLGTHGYKVPPEIQPTIDAYVKEGFDFIALKLVPGKGVSSMQPVRIIAPGAGFALPLRMVGAGTGATTSIKLFVIAEGRYQTKNFANALAPIREVVWDFATNSSDYSTKRAETLRANGGRVFITSYAKQGALLNPSTSTMNMSLGGLCAAQAAANGTLAQGAAGNCIQGLSNLRSSSQLVVDNCDDNGNCSALPAGTISASQFACGKLDDLAVALTGMHPTDVWVTRLEAELPRAALDTDLVLEAAASQTEVNGAVVAPRFVNPPCGVEGSSPLFAPLASDRQQSDDDGPNGVVVLGLAIAALSWIARRASLVIGARTTA
jgi:hypothetical protein